MYVPSVMIKFGNFSLLGHFCNDKVLEEEEELVSVANYSNSMTKYGTFGSYLATES